MKILRMHWYVLVYVACVVYVVYVVYVIFKMNIDSYNVILFI